MRFRIDQFSGGLWMASHREQLHFQQLGAEVHIISSYLT